METLAGGNPYVLMFVALVCGVVAAIPTVLPRRQGGNRSAALWIIAGLVPYRTANRPC